MVVRLPLARAAGDRPFAAAEPAPATCAPASPLRVLAAEDNPVNQRVLAMLLETLGVTPTVVENGRLAVDAWRRTAFDLILMDIQMPVLDGVSAAEEIRRIEQSEARTPVPIFALTANVMKEQVASYLQAGMDGHVAKPILVEQLVEALEAAEVRRQAAALPPSAAQAA